MADGKDKDRTNAPDVVLCVDGPSVEHWKPVLRHLCVGLIDQAIHVRLLSSHPGIETLTLGPVQAIQLPRPRRFFADRRMEQVTAALAPRNPTVVHAFGGESYTWALELAVEFDVEAVLAVSSHEEADVAVRLPHPRPFHLAAASAPLRELLTTRYGIARDRTSLIRPGVLSGQKVACFAEERYASTLLCTAAMERGRGVDTFVEATAMLRDRGRDVLAFLIGSGRTETEMRRLARRRELSSIVTFAPQESPTVEIMNSADIFVVPFAAEEIWFRVLQAMGCGLACVVCENGVCDYVRHGHTAMVCRSDARVFADTIEQLLLNHESARALAQAGQDYVREHHTVSAMSQSTADLYRRLSESHKTYAVHT